MTYLHILQLTLAICILVLGYVYALFPLVMGLIGMRAGRQPDSVQMPAKLPSVSLIIPAYNEEAVIESKIRNALAIDYPQNLLDIIVACDGGDDKTADIASRFQSHRLRVLSFAKRRGKASVVNDAIAETNSDVILLCDANVMFAADALRRMLAHFSSPDVGAASGDVRLDSDNSSFGAGESLYYWMERSIHQGESRLASMMGVDGGMYVVRRELFEPLPEDTILDDFTISMNVIRNRKRIKYEPTAIANENATEAAITEFNRRVRLSAGAAQVILRRHFPSITQPVEFATFLSHKILRWASPFIIFTAVIVLSILSFHDLRYRVMMLALLMIATLAAFGALSVRLRRHAVFAVPFYFAMSQIAMAYGMGKGLLGFADARWPRTER